MPRSPAADGPAHFSGDHFVQRDKTTLIRAIGAIALMVYTRSGQQNPVARSMIRHWFL